MTDLQSIPKVGDIWEYPYLWAWQADHGETEGRKARPCALTLVNRKQDNLTEVILVPITTKEPVAGSHFVEVPQIEKRRAGLDERLRLWVICEKRLNVGMHRIGLWIVVMLHQYLHVLLLK